MKQDVTRLQAMLQAAGASHRAGDLAAAVAGYRQILLRLPNHTPTLHLLGIAYLELRDTTAAIRCLRKVSELEPDNWLNLEALGDALQREGKPEDAVSMYRRGLSAGGNALSLSAKIESVGFAIDHLKRAKPFMLRADLLEYSLVQARAHGLVLEFGVAGGATLRFLSSITHDTVYGFDSFQGLPETWRRGFEAGTFARSEVPTNLPANAQLVIGLFAETLPRFREQRVDSVRFAHIDCDLYSSTKTVFDALGDRFEPGTVLVFDEYMNYPGWREHEHRAFTELIEESGKGFEYLGWTRGGMQVAVRFS
jgi:tetratricopeptide (TPR) repeat protein